MSVMDFNTAEPQTEMGGILPEGAVVIVVASIRPGQKGDDGWLTSNKVGDALMLDFEFTVEGGKFDRRKFWDRLIVQGDTEGQQKAATISRGVLRGMLESAHGIDPADDSADAQEARKVSSYGDFDGLRFCAKVGVEKGDNGHKDKNRLRIAVTPDLPGYLSPGGGASTFKPVGKVAAGVVAGAAKAAAAKSAPAGKPEWAS